MRRAILGTAGHIDHGKTALVRALTGVDTDRLPEEKARGITIDLGFAQLGAGDDLKLGVVDVPGHEDFIRTMVAGATGMDVVLLVVAADEGIMPQTREHVDILRMLDVPRMVVALSKADLVEADWLALVEEDVRAYLAPTPWAEAPVVATSSRTGAGVDRLAAALLEAASSARERRDDDVPRLPVDRAFTVQGMGTVVTGTLWSGTLVAGRRVRLLPSGREARVRSLQVHGRDVAEARAGERTALALAGVERGDAERGQVVVGDAPWEASHMLTVRVTLLPETPQPLEHGDRLRVLLGTAEVMARCAVLEEAGSVPPGGSGWVQLRLEEPAVARAGDRCVLRSYSPMATVGGGTVAEPVPPKRRRLEAGQGEVLGALVGGAAEARVEAVLLLAGWSGVPTGGLTQSAGVLPGRVEGLLAAVERKGGVVARGTAFSPATVAEGAVRILEALDRGHREEGLRPSVPLERLRAALPAWASPSLADGIVASLVRDGALELAEGGARRPGFRPAPTPGQDLACRALEEAYRDAGLAAPFLDELPEELRERDDLPSLLRHLEARGVLRPVDDGLFVWAACLEEAAKAVTSTLGGREGLGPADFRDALPVSRRHLMPLLAHLDGLGVTVRRGGVRDVPPRP